MKSLKHEKEDLSLWYVTIYILWVIKMKNSEEYYNKTKGNKPSGLLKTFFFMNFDKELNGKSAIDLGAGAGNDAKFLLKKGFKVTCIDKEEKSKDIIMSQITQNENLKFELQEFENIKLHKADLIYSCFSLHFCNPEKFNDMMNEIINNINTNGFFVGNFLGEEDGWYGNDKMTFLLKERVLDYFKDFEIKYYAEKKYVKDAVIGGKKNWHIFEIIAMKKEED